MSTVRPEGILLGESSPINYSMHGDTQLTPDKTTRINSAGMGRLEEEDGPEISIQLSQRPLELNLNYKGARFRGNDSSFYVFCASQQQVAECA